MNPALETSRFHSADRLVVSSAAGVFHPYDVGDGTRIASGQAVGRIVSGQSHTEVTSPFDGVVRANLAWPEERVQRYQPLLWIR